MEGTIVCESCSQYMNSEADNPEAAGTQRDPAIAVTSQYCLECLQKNDFAILRRVRASLDDKEAKHARRTLSRYLHPDINKSPTAEEQFKTMQGVFENPQPHSSRRTTRPTSTNDPEADAAFAAFQAKVNADIDRKEAQRQAAEARQAQERIKQEARRAVGADVEDDDYSGVDTSLEATVDAAVEDLREIWQRLRR